MNDTNTTDPSSIEGARGTPLDVATTAISCLASLCILIACIPALYWSSLKPLRTKQANLVVISGIFGSILMLASIGTNAHYNVEQGTFWGTCSVWVLWFAVVLGVGPWATALLTRPFRLVLILHFQRVIDTKKTALIMACLEAPWLIYSIFAQIFASAAMYRQEKHICANGGTAWSISLFAIIAIYILFYLILTYLLWRVLQDKSKKGYVELLFEWPVVRTGAIAIIFLLVTNVIIWAVKQAYDVTDVAKMVTRFFLTITTIMAVSFFFWVPIVVPLWNIIFHRETYMKQFDATTDKMRQASVKSGVSRTESFKSSIDDNDRTPR